MNYTAIYQGNFIDLLSKETLMSLDRRDISMVCKEYYSIDIKGKKSNVKQIIVLFTNDSLFKKSENYISEYTSLVNLYGVNAINDDDIEVCKYFNDLLKRKRND